MEINNIPRLDFRRPQHTQLLLLTVLLYRYWFTNAVTDSRAEHQNASMVKVKNWREPERCTESVPQHLQVIVLFHAPSISDLIVMGRAKLRLFAFARLNTTNLINSEFIYLLLVVNSYINCIDIFTIRKPYYSNQPAKMYITSPVICAQRCMHRELVYKHNQTISSPSWITATHKTWVNSL